jgi:hypothetical protein
VCVPGKAAIKMKSKIFNMIILRYLYIVYMNWWAKLSP